MVDNLYSPFGSILSRGVSEGYIPAREQESRDWFRNQAQQVKKISDKDLYKSEILKSKPFPGFMYLFMYNPKHKQTLPYYDTLPLVFPFEVDGEGFTGINFHYLDLNSRAKLMDMLYNLVNNKKYDETTRLKLVYKTLKAVCKIPYYKACTKRYLYSQVRSRYILIPANEWDIALFLPLERFMKKPKTVVFSESRKIIARK
jgi:hypothetical protein